MAPNSIGTEINIAELANYEINHILRGHELCKIGRKGAYFDHLRTKCKRRGTRWRSEVNSNCRYRFANHSVDSIRRRFATPGPNPKALSPRSDISRDVVHRARWERFLRLPLTVKPTRRLSLGRSHTLSGRWTPKESRVDPLHQRSSGSPE